MQLSDFFQVKSTQNQILHFKLKGFWNDQFVNELGDQFVNEWKRTVDSMGGKFIALADAAEFKPYTTSAKNLVSKTMEYAQSKGLYKAVEVLPDAVAQLSVKEAASSTENKDFRVIVSSLSEGQARANELKKEL